VEASAIASSTTEATRVLATRMGDTAAIILAVQQLYDGTLLAPRARAMGFERFTRTCALAIQGAFIAYPACLLAPHLVVASLWGRLCNAVTYQWEACKVEGVSTVMAGDEWAKAMRAGGRAFAEATVPIALSDSSKVLKTRAWTTMHCSILDDPNVSDAFALAGGLPALLRERRTGLPAACAS
jgi:hypothetical protein